MNAGFSNLALLKAQLLPSAMRSGTAYNDVILALGLGIAAAFENHCKRAFFRTVGDTATFPADHIHFILPRYPVESISAVDIKRTEADGWESQTVNDFIKTYDRESGVVYLPDGSDAGSYSDQVRFTYTGGYFWETLEPTDGGYPTAVPSGSTALPADILTAWHLQCREVWSKMDKLGATIGSAPDAQSHLAELQLVPLVKGMLRDHVREVWV